MGHPLPRFQHGVGELVGHGGQSVSASPGVVQISGLREQGLKRPGGHLVPQLMVSFFSKHRVSPLEDRPPTLGDRPRDALWHAGDKDGDTRGRGRGSRAPADTGK